MLRKNIGGKGAKNFQGFDHAVYEQDGIALYLQFPNHKKEECCGVTKW
jgi:hypothetical protein